METINPSGTATDARAQIEEQKAQAEAQLAHAAEQLAQLEVKEAVEPLIAELQTYDREKIVAAVATLQASPILFPEKAKRAKGTKAPRRDAAIIAAEKQDKADRKQAFKNLGMKPPKGRMDIETSAKVNSEQAKVARARRAAK